MNRYVTVIILACPGLVLAQEGNARLPYDRSPIPTDVHPAVTQNAPPAIDSLIQRLVNETNLDTLIHVVNILSGEDSVTINDSTDLILSRNPLHPNNNLAADFIFQTLNRFGLQTYNQQYSLSGRNVYSIKVGTLHPQRKVAVCAHYDDSPFEPAPGADDNASGTAAVLEAARVLSQMPTPYTIIFALWDEEEVGSWGSAYFAQQARQAGEDIIGVINVDMLGWDDNSDGLIDIHTRPIANSVQLANLVLHLEDHYSLGLSPIIYNPGTSASDHSSFWRYGYSALVFSEAFWGGDFNPFYQTSYDRRVHFNLGFFHALSKLVIATTAYLSLYDFPTHLKDQEATGPSDFALEQNYPNPFNPITTIGYALPHWLNVNLAVYNTLGQQVAALVNGDQEAGYHEVKFDARDLSSGVYFYRLKAGDFVATKKLLYIR